MSASRAERRAFGAFTALLTLVSLVPLWTSPMPPLQDYPYHLAQVAVLAARDAPDSPFAEHFRTQLAVQPYAGFYLLAVGLARFLPLELAGRVVLSLPFALWGWLLVGGLRRPAGPPWGALAWLPLAAGLSFYLGFVNYLLSVPLLGLALEDLRRFAEEEGPGRAGARLAFWVAGLFLTHPFTFLVFLGLAALRLLVEIADPGARRRALWVLGAAAAIFGVWFVAAGAIGGAAGPQGLRWLPLGTSLAILTLPFTGMRPGGEVAWAPLVLWLGAAGLLAHALWRSASAGAQRPGFWGIAALLVVVAGFAAPFRMGHYSYINARLADVAFLCFGATAGGLRLSRPSRVAWVALVTVALVLGGLQQGRLARELAQVAPLIERIPRGAAVLPLVFDDDSPELDPAFFDVHRHVHNYVHVRRAASVTPYFFRHPLAPVRYRAGSPPAAPPQQRPGQYRFDRHGAYAFLLVRGAPPAFRAYLASGAERVAGSGPWQLFRRADAAVGREGMVSGGQSASGERSPAEG